MTLRSEEIACDIRDQLQTFAHDFEHFSIALDESTDIKDTAQLIIFIRAVTKDLNVTEKILALAGMNGTTTGADIFAELVKAINKFKLPWGKLASITTDGAPAMTGAQNGVVYRLQKLFTANSLVPAYAE